MEGRLSKIQWQHILPCTRVSSAVSSLQLCMEWEQQSQMVNKCSIEGVLHKSRFMRSLAVSFAADGVKSSHQQTYSWQTRLLPLIYGAISLEEWEYMFAL